MPIVTIKDVSSVAALRDTDKVPLGRDGNETKITATIAQIVRFVQSQLAKVFQPIGDYTSMADVKKTMAAIYQPKGDYTTLKDVKADSQVRKAILAPADIGNLDALRTTNRTNLVCAINEVFSKVSYSSLTATLQSFKDSDDLNVAIMANLAELQEYVDESTSQYQVIEDYDDDTNDTEAS